MRLLLVEDDNMLGASLKKALENHAYGVDWVQDGESALISIENSNFLSVILDINLPKVSGMDVLKTIRQRKNKTPVLILTAQDSVEQKVDGLDNGADDYLAKPFDLGELLARLRALIRRSENRLDPTLQCRNIHLDIKAKLVRKDNQTIILTLKEYHVLKLLMEKAGKLVPKSDIEYSLYSAEDAVESNTVEVTIYSLRKKLSSDFIQTVRGMGYMVNR